MLDEFGRVGTVGTQFPVKSILRSLSWILWKNHSNHSNRSEIAGADGLDGVQDGRFCLRTLRGCASHAEVTWRLIPGVLVRLSADPHGAALVAALASAVWP